MEEGMDNRQLMRIALKYIAPDLDVDKIKSALIDLEAIDYLVDTLQDIIDFDYVIENQLTESDAIYCIENFTHKFKNNFTLGDKLIHLFLNELRQQCFQLKGLNDDSAMFSFALEGAFAYFILEEKLKLNSFPCECIFYKYDTAFYFDFESIENKTEVYKLILHIKSKKDLETIFRSLYTKPFKTLKDYAIIETIS